MDLPATTREAIDLYRNAASALRGIKRRGGRTRATTSAIRRHEAAQHAAIVWLEAHGDRITTGWLVEEEKCADRLMGVPRGERLELRERLSHARAALRQYG
jgi:hypothetical protein